LLEADALRYESKAADVMEAREKTENGWGVSG
jgi:hypothetical protein